MGKAGLATVMLSLTTFDPDLKRRLEPRSASSAARLAVMRALVDAGIPVGVIAAPMIPAVNDAELECILELAAEHGATRAGYVLLRLPLEVAALFREWLDEHLPDRAAHVMSLLQGARGGRDNDPSFRTRMNGQGAWATLLRDRFRLACRRLALRSDRELQLDTTQFLAPRPIGSDRQLDRAL
jgi:DNA repair photolyase